MIEPLPDLPFAPWHTAPAILEFTDAQRDAILAEFEHMRPGPLMILPSGVEMRWFHTITDCDYIAAWISENP